ncbi:hypothetical protein J2X76_003914 [Neorhizobium sp. 2083]|uniref:hypothetical protein n=1 Tax=Neorhizobium sp. 2083 TaxID=2817762 RepID=UPI000DDF56A4|nr:hypothetical protein [Neorhizobium sp. 2083]MDR6818732.1 hypothetical protein [Neorhizobium sp. 2083]
MTRHASQLIREGNYVAEVDIELHEDGGEWSPTVGLDDIRKLDRVRRALRSGDLDGAGRDATVFRLVPHRGSGAPALGFHDNDQDGFES